MTEMYRVPLVPGPTTVPQPILDAFGRNYPAGDLEPAFFELYAETQAMLQTLLGTRNSMAIMTGEAMVALWGALKSCLKPGDRVLAVSSGLFGHGMIEMAEGLGCEVRAVEAAWNDVPDLTEVERAVATFKPKLVTMVHCETPSGTLTPVREVGDILRRHGEPLLYVDAVASVGGTPVPVDAWQIDLLLAGSQKCFSAPPGMAVVAVSERAWEVAAEVKYAGYDALLPWRTALAEQYCPYTPSWNGTASLHAACRLLMDEGLDNVYRRHAEVAQRCREAGRALGLSVYPARDAIASPTVTAFNVPDGVTWPELNRRLRERGVQVGGNWGPLAGKVFRLGHMGAQAHPEIVDAAMAALGETLPAGARTR